MTQAESKLKAAFISCLGLEGIGKQEWCQQRGIRKGQLSEWLHTDRGICGDLKKVMFNGWKTNGAKESLFEAHILDEMLECGVGFEINLNEKLNQ